MQTDEIVASEPQGGAMVFGPYITLPPGAYEAKFEVALSNPTSKSTLTVDVVSGVGSRVLASRDIALGTEHPAAVSRLPFTIPEEAAGKYMEFRVLLRSGGLAVKDISFAPVR
jgi:hypothetical protein